MYRVVNKSWGLAISFGYYKAPGYFHWKIEGKQNQEKKIPGCLIPHLLVIFKWQLEILVTTLPIHVPTDNEEKD